MIEKNDNKFIFIMTGVFLVSIISLTLFSRLRKNEYATYAKTFKGETIGLTIRIKSSGRSSFLRYYFYANDKRILGGASIVNPNLVGNFYKVKYDLNDPEKGHCIILNYELKPDSITLVNAGFVKRKKYIYDAGVSCKYIEEVRWE
ncbi:hypothetical protein Flavo103_36880 [Flavobacterium collinsii]|uniref:hypothetical protein n=1 Tax=Flavobacterium collinsii TaxID=1114861 RepID=UPI0022C73799|nr:hypothetical protein [Flavobacterium collinsii]GIQ60552.1 hypothetical protein Flavo103_36880 [Flavobacterium collinsii]